VRKQGVAEKQSNFMGMKSNQRDSSLSNNGGNNPNGSNGNKMMPGQQKTGVMNNGFYSSNYD
jgi:hypothetical protein